MIINTSVTGHRVPTIAQKMQLAASHATATLFPEAVDRIGGFIRSQMNPDGGFKNRAGVSDLYYTIFGLECAKAVNLSLPMDQVEKFVSSHEDYGSLSFVHRISLMRAWALLGLAGRSISSSFDPGRLLTFIEEYRSDDHGFAPRKKRPQGTIYETFLAWLGLEEAGLEQCMDPEQLIPVLMALKTKELGFVNQPQVPIGTTPVTAAAVVLMTHWDKSALVMPTVPWLWERCQKQGGFLASPHTPLPDLLSTATALHALVECQQSLEPIREACLQFVHDLWMDNGGFCGHIMDMQPDCEYVYYGLLSLGHLTHSR